VVATGKFLYWSRYIETLESADFESLKVLVKGKEDRSYKASVLVANL
jgi:hypothetical protein